MNGVLCRQTTRPYRTMKKFPSVMDGPLSHIPELISMLVGMISLLISPLGNEFIVYKNEITNKRDCL